MLLTQSNCSITNVFGGQEANVKSISHPNMIVCYLYIDFFCVVVTFWESGSRFWVDVTQYFSFKIMGNRPQVRVFAQNV
jgi:hypothetical protein